MENKLQELTDQLYNEGLAKGKQEGEEIVLKAKHESEVLINHAKAEAKQIVSDAQKAADELKKQTMIDLKMAVSQSISVVKQEIEKMILTKMVDDNVSQNFNDEHFIKEMIKSIVSAFNPSESNAIDLSITFPETMKAKMEHFILNEITAQFHSAVKINYSSKISGGFIIAPQNGKYFIQFTDKEFKALIYSYLRPATQHLLFG